MTAAEAKVPKPRELERSPEPRRSRSQDSRDDSDRRLLREESLGRRYPQEPSRPPEAKRPHHPDEEEGRRTK